MKTKNKNMTPIHSTIIVGYAIFSVLVVSVVLSTILPFGQLFFSPHVKHFNVAIAFIALSAGAILPAFLAYFVGDNAITSKRKQTHHFNGVLFGLLSYWLISFFSLFPPLFTSNGNDATSTNLQLILANFLPVLGVVVITLVIAFLYARRHKGSLSLINYKPYWVTLLFVMLFSTVYTIISGSITHTSTIYSYLSLGVIALIGTLSYGTLRKSHLRQAGKIAWSGLSVTVLFTIAFVLLCLVSGIFSYTRITGLSVNIAITIATIGASLIGWWIYWRITAAGLRRRRQ